MSIRGLCVCTCVKTLKTFNSWRIVRDLQVLRSGYLEGNIWIFIDLLQGLQNINTAVYAPPHPAFNRRYLVLMQIQSNQVRPGRKEEKYHFHDTASAKSVEQRGWARNRREIHSRVVASFTSTVRIEIKESFTKKS